MSNSVKERISTDLKKARAEGGLRAERIRDIVKHAVSQAIDEIKAGSSEIRVIVKDAITATIENTDPKPEEMEEHVSASIEGAIEGVHDSKREVITAAQTAIDEMQAQLVEEEQQLESDIDSALVAIETSNEHPSSDFKSVLRSAIHNIRERQGFAFLEQQYVRLREQLDILDSRLAERYGDNYAQVKQRLETAKSNAQTWYDQNRSRVEAGEPNPVERKQVEFERKFSQAGTTIAHKEREIKQRVKEFLQTALNKL
jgi:hypothetical protein